MEIRVREWKKYEILISSAYCYRSFLSAFLWLNLSFILDQYIFNVILMLF